MFVVQGIGFCLHAVVQLHEQGLQASVHPLDQFMINHQGPQQDTQHYGLESPLRAQYAIIPRAFIKLSPEKAGLIRDEILSQGSDSLSPPHLFPRWVADTDNSVFPLG